MIGPHDLIPQLGLRAHLLPFEAQPTLSRAPHVPEIQSYSWFLKPVCFQLWSLLSVSFPFPKVPVPLPGELLFLLPGPAYKFLSPITPKFVSCLGALLILRDVPELLLFSRCIFTGPLSPDMGRLEGLGTPCRLPLSLHNQARHQLA